MDLKKQKSQQSIDPQFIVQNQHKQGNTQRHQNFLKYINLQDQQQTPISAAIESSKVNFPEISKAQKQIKTATEFASPKSNLPPNYSKLGQLTAALFPQQQINNIQLDSALDHIRQKTTIYESDFQDYVNNSEIQSLVKYQFRSRKQNQNQCFKGGALENLPSAITKHPTMREYEFNIQEQPSNDISRVSKSVVRQQQQVKDDHIPTSFKPLQPTIKRGKEESKSQMKYHQMNLNSLVQFEKQMAAHLKMEGFKKDKGDRTTKILKQAQIVKANKQNLQSPSKLMLSMTEKL